MLCGEGARLWAEENALKLCDPDDLLTGIISLLKVVLMNGSPVGLFLTLF